MAVVGGVGGGGHMVPLESLSLSCCSPYNGSWVWGRCAICRVIHTLTVGTHDPPYEQRLIGMGCVLVITCWFGYCCVVWQGLGELLA
jgi:hypothetical protein